MIEKARCPVVTAMQIRSQDASKTIGVRQREYGFRKPENVSKQLISKNYWSCIGVAGVHKGGEAAFLCHFDLPWTAWAMDDLIGDIQKQSLDPNDFDIHIYGGIWWVGGLALALLSGWLCWKLGFDLVPFLGWGWRLAIGILMGVAGAVFGSLYALTLPAARWKLRKFGFNKPKSITYWRYALKDGHLFQISIGSYANSEPDVTPQRPKSRDKSFDEQSRWYQKAKKSQDSD